MRTLLMGVSSICIAAASSAVGQDRIEMSGAGMTIWAPNSISCDTPPTFTLEGPAAPVFATDRTDINKIVSQMAKGLAQSCPDVAELTVKGEDRGVDYTFTITRADDWRLGPLPEPEAPKPEPETVAKNAAVAQPPKAAKPAEEKAAEAPAPKAPQKPAIKPGLAFADFARIFGPVAMVRGYAPMDNNDLWSRVLAARAFAERPDLMDNDEVALEIVDRLLTPVEMQQLKGPLAQKHLNQWSVFEKRDLANRIRTQLAPGLEGRRQTGPIDVYHSVPVQLGQYDFARGAFPLDSQRLRQHPQSQWKAMRLGRAFDSFVLPTELKATEEQARQLDAYMQQQRNQRLYLAVFAQIDPQVPPSLDQRNSYNYNAAPMPSELRQIALFADQGLTQILFDFTPVLADQQAQADTVRNYLSQPISGGEDLVRAIGKLNDSDATAEVMAYAYQTSRQEPIKTAEQVLAEFGDTKGPTRITLSGNIQFGTYDPARQMLAVQRFNPNQMRFKTMQLGAGMNFSYFPPLTEIPMTPAQYEQASSLINQGYRMEARMEADVVSGSHNPQQPQYLQIQATLRPHRVLVISGNTNDPVATRKILADAEMPESDGGVSSLIESLRIDK